MKNTSTVVYTFALLLATALPILHTDSSLESTGIGDYSSFIRPGEAPIQLWEGMTSIYQRGELVGQVWTPARAPNACRYMEYWWLAPGYQYPSAQFGGGVKLETIPDGGFEGTLDEFRTAMQTQFGGGYLVRVSSVEERPGCPAPSQAP